MAEPDDRDPSKHRFDSYMTVAVCLLISLVMAFEGSATKILSAQFSVFQLGAWRFLSMLVPAAVLCDWHAVNPLSIGQRRAGMLVLRALLATTSSLFLTLALHLMPVGDVSAITFCRIAFTVMFSRCLLGEKVTLRNAVYAVAALGGGVLVARPSILFGDKSVEASNRLLGSAAAFAMTVAAALLFIVTRWLKNEPQNVIIVYSGSVGLVVASALSALPGAHAWTQPDDWLTMSLLLCNSLFAFSGIWLRATALRLDSANRVTILLSANVVFSYVLQIFWFDEVPFVVSVIGAAILLTVVIASSWPQSGNPVAPSVVALSEEPIDQRRRESNVSLGDLPIPV